MNVDLLRAGFLKHYKPNHVFVYGTAGFRQKCTENDLDFVGFCCGVLASIVSAHDASKDGCEGVAGIMITASHNPARDNGLKVVDSKSEMIGEQWEALVVSMANSKNVEEFLQVLKPFVDGGNVLVARDTRPSGISILETVKEGVFAMSGAVEDLGVTSTPVLHWITKERAMSRQSGVQEYFKELASGYDSVVKGSKASLVVDCANGVGALVLNDFKAHVKSLDMQIVNEKIEDSALLNEGCGADFVKMGQKAPQGLDMKEGVCYASFDGDADRILFYFLKNGKFCLCDGDKIALLAVTVFEQLVKEAKLDLKVGLVQTAYANGASTAFARDHGVEVQFTKTGVKHLHHVAKEYDLGVYFEANGHGTVLLSDKALQAFKSGDGEASKTLLGFSRMINQTVGDALSDLLMVQALLICTKKSMLEWSELYFDLPNRQLKVDVKDRSIFKPILADTQLESPIELQEYIDASVKTISRGRCFVRPSGTEAFVRVYVEAENEQDCIKIGELIVNKVKEY